MSSNSPHIYETDKRVIDVPVNLIILLLKSQTVGAFIFLYLELLSR